MKTIIIFFCLLVFSVILVINQDEVFETRLKYFWTDTLIDNSTKNLLLGSSSIARLDVKKYLACGDWLNRGIGSSDISDIKSYIEYSFLSISPANIILYVGDNDVATGTQVEIVISEYIDLISVLKHKYPKSKLHLLLIKPSPARQGYWYKFQLVNKAIIQYALGNANIFTYNDLWSKKLDDMATYFVNDGVHLSDRGYELFVLGVNKKCTQN